MYWYSINIDLYFYYFLFFLFILFILFSFFFLSYSIIIITQLFTIVYCNRITTEYSNKFK